MRDRKLLIAALFVVAATALVLIWDRSPVAVPQEAEIPVQTASLQVDEFGVSIEGLSVEEATVRRNQTFSDLLNPHGVDYERIVSIARDHRDVFDVRRMRFGRSYRVYKDSTGTGRYMVYERDVRSFVVFDLGAEPTVRLEEKDVTVKVRDIEGTITESLYMSLLDQDINPVVANKMAQVYAWQIDFSRLQKGDSFRVTFEEQWVGDEFWDVGEVLAARFEHMGDDFYAFHYSNGEIDEYYDEQGKSLRKAFLIAPVEYKRISSGFTKRRFHPVQKRYKAHLGTDYAADPGTPIFATGDGVVTEARYGQFNGNYVKIRHNGTYTTQYLHMSKIKSGIRPGVRVKQGQEIGYVGSTGLASGPHVCYRFWVNGEQQDHRRLKLPSVGPIPAQYLADFNVQRDEYLIRLSEPAEGALDLRFAQLLDTPEAITSP